MSVVTSTRGTIATHLVSLYSSRCCLVHSVDRARDSRSDANRWVTLSARRWESLGNEHARVSREPWRLAHACNTHLLKSSSSAALATSTLPATKLPVGTTRLHLALRCGCGSSSNENDTSACAASALYADTSTASTLECRRWRGPGSSAAAESLVLKREFCGGLRSTTHVRAWQWCVSMHSVVGIQAHGEAHLELDALRSPARTCARAGWGNTLSAVPLDARALLGDPGSMDEAESGDSVLRASVVTAIGGASALWRDWARLWSSHMHA